MDRLVSMQVFVKVVEQGSFAQAARLLNMSNAVVTRHVASLEESVGIRLLNRTTRRLSLTETGQLYFERVQRILEDIEEADTLAMSQSQKKAGRLRICAHTGFGQSQLPGLLARFSEANPDIVLDVTLTNRTVNLVENGYDIGIFINLQKFDASMIVRQLGTSEVMLCASPAYIARHGMPQSLDDISRHTCLNFSYDELRYGWPMRGPDGDVVTVRVNGNLISNNGELLRQCGLSGMGIVGRPSFSLYNDLAEGRFVRLLPQHSIGHLSVMMVYPSRRLLSAKVRSFVDFMNAHYPEPEADPWRAINLARHEPAAA